MLLFTIALAALLGAPDDKVPMPPVPTFSVDDPAAYGLEIATYSDLRDQGWADEVMQGRMTLFDADGDSVRRTFSRMAIERADKGDKLIIKFLSPAEIKGVAALTHENPGGTDDNWLYLPANKRVRRISGANNTASFQGTEFTYEDLANLDPREYTWRFYETTTITQGKQTFEAYKLEARPTYSDTGYSRLVAYYDTKEWRPLRTEYYDLAGKHLKTRDSRGWKHRHERFWRPAIMEMTNHQTGKRTLLEFEKQFLDLSRFKSKKTGKPRKNLVEDQFTTRALQN